MHSCFLQQNERAVSYCARTLPLEALQLQILFYVVDNR